MGQRTNTPYWGPRKSNFSVLGPTVSKNAVNNALIRTSTHQGAHSNYLASLNHCSRAHTRNRNRKLLISRAPTKAKSQEPAYLQALNQSKIDSQGSRSRDSGRQTVRRLWWMVFGVETGR